jgi:hypothetical protein
VKRASPLLTVYSRSYCHLCDDMIAALHQLQGRYGELVPVLTADQPEGEHELCHYFLDEPAVTAFLTKIR